MEAAEEAMSSNSNELHLHSNYDGHLMQPPNAAAKGKRTKRLAADSSSASSTDHSYSITQEDEDMANCLMLLAQGRASMPKPETPTEEPATDSDDRSGLTEKFARRIPEAAVAATTTSYECKTCNKCFPSFQALGGHRAGHKKPKLAAMAAEEKKTALIEGVTLRASMNSLSTSFAGASQNNYYIKVNKIHECSLCGSEFSSGQALGGHMRRHRPAVISESQQGKKERSLQLLSLDLNLPAPSIDGEQSLPAAFAFTGEQRLLFSASSSALVGCHY
ncbi:zinc finger protein ZAT5 [Canna indica]|uniref:Zinc finger protein ZAT5 n=1 Tax=Canna indica TaxID=4628 RepID=A0AAQ3KFU7_9LILI|nr:zinc finger protein ZAT5 [Canna indica]